MGGLDELSHNRTVTVRIYILKLDYIVEKVRPSLLIIIFSLIVNILFNNVSTFILQNIFFK